MNTQGVNISVARMGQHEAEEDIGIIIWTAGGRKETQITQGESKKERR